MDKGDMIGEINQIIRVKIPATDDVKEAIEYGIFTYTAIKEPTVIAIDVVFECLLPSFGIMISHMYYMYNVDNEMRNYSNKQVSKNIHHFLIVFILHHMILQVVLIMYTNIIRKTFYDTITNVSQFTLIVIFSVIMMQSLLVVFFNLKEKCIKDNCTFNPVTFGHTCHRSFECPIYSYNEHYLQFELFK
ncbi:hypothetical protein A3Q56_07107 [Intoshia linei]|uniref:Uncharacterized protein n=1 Tax=Intoshia linei TaxID=1819745 RepID=A0A177AT28_9BILA|nr:hypothetical protein A3Q56_07107 [Intoshia linei]